MYDQLLASLSVARFSTYLRATAFDFERAKRLYVWNVEVGAAFYLPIQGVEVVLRNQIVTVIRERFGLCWWEKQDFISSLNNGSKSKIQQNLARLKKSGIEINEGQVVSGLSLGFWASLMDPDNRIAFVDEWQPPAPSHEILFVRRSIWRVCELRNRISHHEPIFQRDLLYEYSFIMRLLNWLCPATHNWIRPHCRVPALVRQKP